MVTDVSRSRSFIQRGDWPLKNQTHGSHQTAAHRLWWIDSGQRHIRKHTHRSDPKGHWTLVNLSLNMNSLLNASQIQDQGHYFQCFLEVVICASACTSSFRPLGGNSHRWNLLLRVTGGRRGSIIWSTEEAEGGSNAPMSWKTRKKKKKKKISTEQKTGGRAYRL